MNGIWYLRNILIFWASSCCRHWKNQNEWLPLSLFISRPSLFDSQAWICEWVYLGLFVFAKKNCLIQGFISMSKYWRAHLFITLVFSALLSVISIANYKNEKNCSETSNQVPWKMGCLIDVSNGQQGSFWLSWQHCAEKKFPISPQFLPWLRWFLTMSFRQIWFDSLLSKREAMNFKTSFPSTKFSFFNSLGLSQIVNSSFSPIFSPEKIQIEMKFFRGELAFFIF